MTKCFGAVADDPGMPTILFKDAISKSKDYVNQFGAVALCVEVCRIPAEAAWAANGEFHQVSQDKPSSMRSMRP